MNFMYIQQSMKKVRLVADGGDWIWEIDGRGYAINPAIERLLVYYFHTGAYTPFYELLRSNLPKKVNMTYSPEYLKASFEELHPSESIEAYSRDLIPEYADPVNGMWVNSEGKTSFWISLDDERKMLFELKNTGYVWNNCLHHLRMAADRYGLHLSDEFLSQSLEMFLEQHGLNPYKIRSEYYKSDGDTDDQSNAVQHQMNLDEQAKFNEVKEYASKEWAKQRHYKPHRGTQGKSSLETMSTEGKHIVCALLAIVTIVLWFIVFGVECTEFEFFAIVLPLVSAVAGYVATSISGDEMRKSGVYFAYIFFFAANAVTGFVAAASSFCDFWMNMGGFFVLGVSVIFTYLIIHI